MNGAPTISLSVVSHRQAALLAGLLDSLPAHCTSSIELLITANVAEEPVVSGHPLFPTRCFTNPQPKGFGENHNAAFRQARGDYFCVLNPDIRFTCDPFPALIELLQQHPRAGVAAPLVTSPAGALEDSARPFPTPWSIVKKFFGRNPDHNALRQRLENDTLKVDWIAGMFMLFPREVFAQLEGFDEAFFLYYEDVDLCSRLRARGQEVLVSPRVAVIHDARRESHRNLRYLRWHLSSMLRFFITHALRQRRGQQHA